MPINANIDKAMTHLYSLLRKAGTFFRPDAGLLEARPPAGGMVVNAWLDVPASCMFEGSL